MTYQVVGECAYVTVDGQQGRQKVLLYKGSVLPDNAPEVAHLLSMGLIAKVGGGKKDEAADAGVNAEGTTGPAETPTTGDDASVAGVVSPATTTGPEQEAARRQAEARSKLPKDGSAPHANTGEDVWIEYAVSKGMDRTEATKAGKEEIRKALAASK